MADRSQDPHLVESVLGLLVGQIAQLHLLQRVDLVVGEALDLVDGGVSALA